MKGFAVTFERYTTESVENGDAEERGYLLQNATLRDALAEFESLDALDSIEADVHPVSRAHPPRWFTATQGSDRYLYLDEGDEGESRSLHIPDSVTVASRLRIARLLGVRVS